MSTYLITQATGEQSRWVITHLLKSGAKVHAMVRDLAKTPPMLHNDDITLFQGESRNVEDVMKAAEGCSGVFLNTVAWAPLALEQAQAIVDGCRKRGIKQVVASTTYTTGNKALWDNDETREMGLFDYWKTKSAVEDIVRSAGFETHTILRPAVIHYDFFVPGSFANWPRLSTHGVIDHLLRKGSKLPYTDGHDIGRYAAAAFLDPAKFNAQGIDLSSGSYDFDEIREILTKVSGKDVKVVQRTTAEMEEMGITVFGQRFHLWGNLHGFTSVEGPMKKVEEKFGIPFTPLEDALQRDKSRLLDCLQVI